MRAFLVLASIWACSIGAAFSQPAAGDQTQPPDAASIIQRGAGPADWLFPVEKLDDRLPRWLRLSGEYRTRLESADGIKFTRTRDLYLLSRWRLDLTIQPIDWLTLFMEGQDSRVFFNHHVPNAMPYQDTWDIRQAYLQLGSSAEGWADLVAGRQVLSFGDERVIGPSDWINEGRTFDAIRLDLHHTHYKVSLFASSVVVGRDGEIDHHIEGNDFYGAYGSLKNAIPRATLEPYVLWRVAPAAAGLAETAHRGHLSEVTPGVHLAGALPAGFDYDLEIDVQRGALGGDSIRAWAGYANLGRTFKTVMTAPRVFVETNYATGTKNPSGATWSTFDQIYPSGHDKLDFADQAGRRNIQQVRAGVRETVSRKWKLNETYEDLWLATTHDAFYGSSGAISIAADPAAASRHVGQELDVWGEYEINRGLVAGFGYARLFTGQFLRTACTGKDYNYPFLFLTYRLRGR